MRQMLTTIARSYKIQEPLVVVTLSFFLHFCRFVQGSLLITPTSQFKTSPKIHRTEIITMMVDPDHDPESLDKVAELRPETEKRGLDNGGEKIERVASTVQDADFVQHRDKASELRQRKSSNPYPTRKLSMSSQQYDLDNNGVLDEHEKELRAMDQGKKMRSPHMVVVKTRRQKRFH
jgi:hypothetical protein